jgi:spoIIIJ-associated protein
MALRSFTMADPEPEDNTLRVARQSLAELLDKMKVKAEVRASWGAPEEPGEAPPLLLDVQGNDLGLLIGRKGETLAALQYIVRLIVSQRLHTSAPLVLDVNGYKKRRYESLRTLAWHVAEQVSVSHRSFTLEPMPAYERRIVHLELANHPSVTTQSAGFGEARKVVVMPKEETAKK